MSPYSRQSGHPQWREWTLHQSNYPNSSRIQERLYWMSYTSSKSRLHVWVCCILPHLVHDLVISWFLVSQFTRGMDKNIVAPTQHNTSTTLGCLLYVPPLYRLRTGKRNPSALFHLILPRIVYDCTWKSATRAALHGYSNILSPRPLGKKPGKQRKKNYINRW